MGSLGSLEALGSLASFGSLGSPTLHKGAWKNESGSFAIVPKPKMNGFSRLDRFTGAHHKEGRVTFKGPNMSRNLSTSIFASRPRKLLDIRFWQNSENAREDHISEGCKKRCALTRETHPHGTLSLPCLPPPAFGLVS